MCAGPQSETNCGTHIVVGVDGVKAFREGKAVVGSNADRSDTQHVCIGSVVVVCVCVGVCVCVPVNSAHAVVVQPAKCLLAISS